ncbi:linoleate 13S-lipoxygenase 2-1, chloroplastic-like [Syzygium oleosum]|uniref:linoleate 13S-lipoxygenase 2-1, chloroplastic-like n=1 Tax=Syzygium oleosum TaxID=219896 RepID=UPI0011D22E5F|nr:linoleate 13S-lipoxygenase 2-1, chloroplastic-like [Syzygium oleosum]
MLTPQLNQSPSASPTLVPLSKPSSQGNGEIAILPGQSAPALQKSPRIARVGLASSKIEAVASPSAIEKSLSVKAVVTVKPSTGGLFSDIGISGGLDKVTDLVGKTLLLELVSAELDPKTGQEKGTINGYVHKTSHNEEEVTYECKFEVEEEFGEVGAIFVENEHHKEMYLKDIVLDGFVDGPLSITCNSWVHSKFDNPQKRVFFTNKCYLPTETPSGLRRLRGEELAILRGNGQGDRKSYERIYDYDVYNDLGNPDSGMDKKRSVLGGKELLYPRRCRTGRPRCTTDPQSESRSGSIYVPRDEQFSTIKSLTFSAKTVYSVVHALVPSLETAIVDADLGFPFFTAIDQLFNEGINLPPLQKQGFLKDLFPRLVKTVTDAYQAVLRFETPETMERNRFFWFSDEEFARQTLAGINPYAIELVTEWPLRSKLDPTIYGPLESAITTDIIEREIKGFMTVDEAIKKKKLFMLDYHDLFLPYVNKVRQLKGTTLYGSRTLFFLTPNETLKLLAIELTRPPTDDGKPQWKQVFTPFCHSTSMWLWRLAKVHVLAHDSGYHQLVSHWLRTHCATEPYIIAANRQLSVMHPIYKLLHPHFRYTMEINALARGYLVNGDGIIESTFSPGKYSMELCAVAYDKLWQFDLQGLPNDLISRGLAVEDPTAPHGLKLAIEDYPFANDGLLLWDTIKEWVTDYVNHYYPDPSRTASDQELQSWWTEIRTVGHGDKRDSPGWPDLKTPPDLIHIITTIVWVTSGHHAAVNFGQYTYGGYFPNRPTIARTKMPVEDPTEKELKIFWNKPEVTLLTCFPSQIQATKVMAVLDVLSNHSPDEEYLGQDPEPAWKEEPVINAAFERFNGRLKELAGIIDARNNDQRFKNRNGTGIVPYELLKPFSEPGVTGKGVPYSISI